SLTAPTIALETASDGRGNWQADAVPGPPTPTSAGATSLIAAFAVGRVSVTDGTITIGAPGAATVIALDRFDVQARDADAPIGLTWRGKLGDIAVAVAGTVPSYSS